MELNAELIKLITSGGLNVVLFIIWFITAKTMQKQYNDTQEQNRKMYNESHEQNKKMQEQNMAIVNRMFAVMEADMKYHELLTGILGRIELKLDVSIQRERKD